MNTPATRCCILFAVLLVLFSGASFGSYKDDIGHTQLTIELGAAIPDGSGVNVTQVEADSTNDDPDVIITYSPDPANSQFTGKNITDVSAISTAFSGHATSVGGTFYGNTTSIAPGIFNIDSYEAVDWLTGGFLLAAQSGSGPKPQPLITTSRVSNPSYGWDGSGEAVNSDFLRRIDWLTERDELVQTIAVANVEEVTDLPLLTPAYNVISVGRTDGGVLTGSLAVDGVYNANRAKPDIVAPLGATSFELTAGRRGSGGTD